MEKEDWVGGEKERSSIERKEYHIKTRFSCIILCYFVLHALQLRFVRLFIRRIIVLLTAAEGRCCKSSYDDSADT